MIKKPYAWLFNITINLLLLFSVACGVLLHMPGALQTATILICILFSLTLITVLNYKRTTIKLAIDPGYPTIPDWADLIVDLPIIYILGWNMHWVLATLAMLNWLLTFSLRDRIYTLRNQTTNEYKPVPPADAYIYKYGHN